MKNRIINIAIALIFLIGLSLLLYPTVSDFYNSRHQSHVITDYIKEIDDLDEKTYQSFMEAAQTYNEKLRKKQDRFTLNEEEQEAYYQQLSIDYSSVMGYIEISKINCKLPIYHGTDESVLQVGAGHLEGTSLPIGGKGTHCVLSGHRGLPSAKLFSDLDQMVEGDKFVLYVLNEKLTYQVDQILIVEPENMGPLAIDENQDYCTLVTCTPYGVNTHRLLIRGTRIPNEEELKSENDKRIPSAGLLLGCGFLTTILILAIRYLFKSKKNKSGSIEVLYEKKEK